MGKSRRRSTSAATIWNKIDVAVLVSAQDESPKVKSEKGREDQQILGRKRRVVGRDVLGSFLWVYLLVKIFVIDIDRVLVSSIDSNLVAILDYRLLFYLVVVAVVIWIAKVGSKKKVAVAALYVLCFPLVVLCWKLPKAIYNRKSWPVALAVLNVIATFATNYVFYVVLYTVAGLSVTFTVVSDSRSVLIASTGVLISIIVLLFCRATRMALSRSGFLDLQRRGVLHLLKMVREYSTLDSKLKSPKIEKYNKKQAESIRDKLSIGLSAAKLADFWIYLVEEYRRSGITVVFSVLSYISLFLQVFGLATFVNLGLAKIFPEDVRYETVPTLLQYFNYTLNSFVVNSVDELKAVGGPPLVMKMALGVAGILILSIFLMHLIVNHRKVREDYDHEKYAKEVRSTARSLEGNLYREYQVTPADVLARLHALGSTFYTVVSVFVARQMGDEEPD